LTAFLAGAAGKSKGNAASQEKPDRGRDTAIVRTLSEERAALAAAREAREATQGTPAAS
jgi:hypothetical protein